MNKKRLLIGTAVHEIGHNLGAEHTDGTQTMQSLGIFTKDDKIVYVDYPKVVKKHLEMIFRRMNTPKKENGDGRIWKRK